MNLRARVIAISIVIFTALVYLFAWSSLFSVKSIEVSGLPKELSAETVIAKTEIVKGEKLARIEPRAIEKKLSEMSWVKQASVDRNWITGHVTIALAARIPVGIFQGKALDATGKLFELPGNTPKGLPVVSASSPALGLNAIDLFTALPADIQGQVISINAANQSSISSWQNFSGRQIKVMWGSPRQVELKVSVYRALLALPENKNVKRVDLSAPHAPIVK
jgi:cell division septal protein FtsQ